MNRSTVIAGAIALTLLLAAPAAFAQTWELDKAHSNVSFSVKHLMVTNVRGEFRDFTATVTPNEKDVTKSAIEAVVKVTSIDTREPKRDEHLKSADFFDVAKFPDMVFKSTSISKAGKGKFKMKGDLTVHGVTKPVVFDLELPAAPVKDPWGMERIGALATATINRKDFGVTWNKTLDNGGLLVGEEVKIIIDAELLKKPPEQPKAEAKPAEAKPDEKK